MNFTCLMHVRQTSLFGLLLLLFGVSLQLTEMALAEEAEEPTMDCTTSWFGNSWGGGGKWMQQSIGDLYVTADGRCLTNSGWDEAHREASIYHNADVVAGVPMTKGNAVTASDKYVFVPVVKDGKAGIARFWLDRFDPSKNTRVQFDTKWTRPAALPESDQHTVYWLDRAVYHHARHKRLQEIAENPEAAEKYKRSPPQIVGLAVFEDELFVSEDIQHRIHVLDTETLTIKRSFAPGFRYPSRMAFDCDGLLWLVQRPQKAEPSLRAWNEAGEYRIVQFTRDGQPTGKTIDFPGRARDLAFTPDGLLVVADNGPRQQVIFYDISGAQPVETRALGCRDGVFAHLAESPAGRMADDKLMWLSGAGCDAEGNVYVSSRGAYSMCEIRKFSREGELLWRIYSNQFSNSADVDPADHQDVYTHHHRFRMDWSKSRGEEGQWVAHTVDPFRYPDDPRLRNQSSGSHIGHCVLMRRLEGRLYMFVVGSLGRMAILRKDPDSELFIPSVILSRGKQARGNWPENQPQWEDHQGGWVWRDADGEGDIDDDEYEPWPGGNISWSWWPDSRGDVWLALRQGGLRSPLQGFDEHGNPIYTLESTEEFAWPKPFPEDWRGYDKTVKRLEYDAENDRMYLAGYHAEDPAGKQRGSGGVGNLFLRFDDWSDPARRRIVSQIKVPNSTTRFGERGRIISMCIIDEYVVFAQNGGAILTMYNTRDGSRISKIVPGPEVYSQSGAIDIRFGVRGFRRENGEIVLFAEENLKAKQMIYRIPPRNLKRVERELERNDE